MLNLVSIIFFIALSLQAKTNFPKQNDINMFLKADNYVFDGKILEIQEKAKLLKNKNREKKQIVPTYIKKYKKALKIYKTLALNNKSVIIELKIITLYKKLKMYDLAKQEARKAIKLFPQKADLYILLGGLERFMDDNKAIEVYKRGIENADDKENLFRILGNIYSNKQNLEPLYEFLKNQLDKVQNRIPVLYELGRVCMRLKKKEMGLKYFKEVYKLDKNNERAILYLVLAYMSLNKPTKALEICLEHTSTISISSRLKRTTSMIIYANIRGKKPIKQIPILENVIAKKFYDERTLLWLSNLYNKFKRWKDEERLLKLYIKIFPGRGDGYNNLGYRYVEQNVKLEKAEWLIRKAISLQPKNGNYYDSLAMLYLRLKKPQHAESAFKKALKYTPNNWEILLHYADFLKLQGKMEEASVFRIKGEALKKEELGNKE